MKEEIDELIAKEPDLISTALRLMLADPNENHEIIRAICTRMAKSYERVLPLYMIANETMETHFSASVDFFYRHRGD